MLTAFARRSSQKGPPIWTALLTGSLLGLGLVILSHLFR